jgi:hypothetical protein
LAIIYLFSDGPSLLSGRYLSLTHWISHSPNISLYFLMLMVENLSHLFGGGGGEHGRH